MIVPLTEIVKSKDESIFKGEIINLFLKCQRDIQVKIGSQGLRSGVDQRGPD